MKKVSCNSFQCSSQVISDYDVLPGQTIILPAETFDDGRWVIYYFYVDEFPVEAETKTIFIRFNVAQITANYAEDGNQVSAGDVVPIAVVNDNWESVLDYVFPIKSGKSVFLPTLIYKTVDWNQVGAQWVILSDLSPDQLAEPFTVNSVCFKAQGNAVVSEFVYHHVARETSPFKDVILDTGYEKIYLKDTDWQLNDSTFKLTTPHLHENGQLCLDLQVSYPEEPLEDFWFNLSSIKAKDTNGNLIPVYNPYAPLGTSIPLSADNPVFGAIYSFLQ